MSEIGALGNSLTMEIASQVTDGGQARLKEAVEVRILAETLDTQKSVANELLQSLGLGRNLDLEA
jgi:hypothetical protein